MMKNKMRANFLIEPSLWETFRRVCEAQDTTASREIRQFIREYLRKHSQQDWIEHQRKKKS